MLTKKPELPFEIVSACGKKMQFKTTKKLNQVLELIEANASDDKATIARIMKLIKKSTAISRDLNPKEALKSYMLQVSQMKLPCSTRKSPFYGQPAPTIPKHSLSSAVYKREENLPPELGLDIDNPFELEG